METAQISIQSRRGSSERDRSAGCDEQGYLNWSVGDRLKGSRYIVARLLG